MADEDDKLEIDNADAEKLLSDPADDENGSSDTSATDDTDWKAEAEKWKSLSRKNEKTATERATALKKYEDANKTDAERREERATAAEARATKAETALLRREVAESSAPEGATVAQLKNAAKRIVGDTREELEQDAADYWSEHPVASAAAKTTGRPKERLRGGSDPEEPVEENDPIKLAAMIPRRR